jgi:precorrin-6B methylase 2
VPARSTEVLRALAFSALLLVAPAALQATPGDAPEVGQVSRDSVWVPTPERVIRRMLQIADTTSEDVVIDLGSGDGRIPIYAAKHFGARAIGVELEENLVRLSREKAAAQGVAGRVTLLQGDLFEADLSQASVIALYISPGVMTRLKPRLLDLKPGTRVVSHHFTLDDWESDETIRVEGRSAHLWVVPAMAQGEWSLRLPGDVLTLRINQRFQRISATAERNGKAVPVVGAKLRGVGIEFTTFDRDGAARHFAGTIEGDRMRGSSQGQGIKPLPWSAPRER